MFVDGETMIKKKIHKGRTVSEYLVEHIPLDTVDFDVIEFCDRGNFGGRVVRTSPTTAHVYVYTD
jgi:hypothetical protein